MTRIETRSNVLLKDSYQPVASVHTAAASGEQVVLPTFVLQAGDVWSITVSLPVATAGE